MEKKLKIAVIGGGSSYTPELIDGFIQRAAELPVAEIHLVDISGGVEKLEIVTALARRMVTKAGLNLEVKATLDRRSAIAGADYVMTQLRVGGLEARAKDERIPLKYNVIGQETTGPGGFAKALRTIPVILDICRDMEDLAPEAWLINFTNPAGMVTEAVQQHTNIKVMGLCNVPIGMRNNIATIMDLPASELLIEFAGLNHLVWGHRIWHGGQDITQGVIEKLADGASMTMRNIPDLEWDGDFLKNLDMIPCPYHRYFYMTDHMLQDEKEAFEQNGSRALQVMEIERDLFKRYQDPSLEEKPAELEMRGGAWYSDAAVSLISAIHNDKREIHPVNVANRGAIQGLSSEAVVEVNAVIGKHGALPMNVEGLPADALGLMQSVKAYEQWTIEAATTGSVKAAIHALAVHPLVPSITTAKDLVKDILKENKNDLPAYWKIEE